MIVASPCTARTYPAGGEGGRIRVVEGDDQPATSTGARRTSTRISWHRRRISSRHEPQRVPAPHRSPMSSSSTAPSSISARMVRSLTARQWQTYIRLRSPSRRRPSVDDDRVVLGELEPLADADGTLSREPVADADGGRRDVVARELEANEAARAASRERPAGRIAGL